MTRLISTATGGTQGNGASTSPSTSSDGRYVAYLSYATNLVSGDTNNSSDIFVTDTQTGTTTRVSTATGGAEGNGHNYNPSISSDGRYVAYYSTASNLVSGDTNGQYDIFVTDTQTGTTTRVSTATGGAEGNGSNLSPSISSDGRYVAYFSSASNLVSGDTNGQHDVFVTDTRTGTTTRVSAASDGTQGNGSSEASSLSSDGRYVAYSSEASNLVGGDTNSQYDVFVTDRLTGTTTRVSTARDGTQGNGSSDAPSLSSDGRYVAYTSSASNLVGGDTNNQDDVFVTDTRSGTTIRVSTASDGTQGDNTSWTPSISSDGRYVAYSSFASTLVSGDTNGKADIFVTDTRSGTTIRVSTASDGTQGNNISQFPSISTDGSTVAYQSRATNLVSGDANGGDDIFLSPVDFAVPVLSSATVNGTSLVLTYTDGAYLDATNIPAASAFSVSAGGAPVTVSGVAVNTAAKTVTLTLASAVSYGQAVTVGYSDPTAGNDASAIQDISGNDAASISGQAVTNNTPDTTAPVFASATVNGTALVLSYSDAATLDATNIPAASAFSVSAGGAAVTVSSVAVNAAAKTVTLTLATAVAGGQAVTVSYTDPTTGDDANAIQDIFGQDAASISNRTVTNTVPAPGGYDGGTSTPTSTPGTSSLSSAITQSSLGDGDKTAASDALQTFLASLPAGTPVTTSTVTPTSAPGGTLTISGTSATEAMVIDVSQLPPGTILILENIEFAIIIGAAHVTGGAGSNYVIGDGNAQYIVLGAEDDTLMGGAGADTIGSASGRDSLMGGDDGDVVFGGEDGDFLYGNAGADAVYGNSGADQLYGGQGADWLFGGQDADTLRGDKGVDVLYGDKGGDLLYGNTGDDWLLGGDGDDVLFGGQGNDWLAGEAGDDWLAGDLGADTLSGSAGADRFYLAAPNLGADVISDFTSGSDAIVVKSPNFGSLPVGTLDSRYFALSGAETADSRFVFNAATGVLSYDADGAGALAGVAIAGLTNRVQLSASDIVVVA